MATADAGSPTRTLGPPFWVAASAALGWLAASDVGFRDAGEIGTAGFGLGVAHPTGFAFDLLLLRLASLLPLGHIAFRQNLMVALEAAAALGVLAALCDVLARKLGVKDEGARLAGALLAVCGLGAFRTFYETAVAVEVYSLALLGSLLAGLAVAQGGRLRGLAWLVLGFSPGLHVTAGLFAALLVTASLAMQPRTALRALAAHAPVVVLGALIIAYLPLSSARNPALDWGDPETPARILAHLTAARIRGAYAEHMLANDPLASLQVVDQWLELWPLLVPALLSITLGRAQPRLVVLAPLAMLAADLAYAVWINPMGAADRQTGHAAGACLALLAGLGTSLAYERIVRAGHAHGRLAVASGVFALASWVVLRFPVGAAVDGYAASELMGSGGPLAALPARAVFVCGSDDACAGSLFAIHVEGVRPDVATVPAQHLWDPTVLRRLSGLRLSTAPQREPPPSERAERAVRVLRQLAAPSLARPLLLESADPLHRAGFEGPCEVSEDAPYVRARNPDAAARARLADALTRLDRLRRARLEVGKPQGDRTRTAWSQVYASLGEQALGSELAVRALRVATMLTPERAVAFTNLGLALESVGDLGGAVASIRRAIELAPNRPTPWVHAVRLAYRLEGPAGGKRMLGLARHAGIRDRRLDELGARP